MRWFEMSDEEQIKSVRSSEWQQDKETYESVHTKELMSTVNVKRIVQVFETSKFILLTGSPTTYN
ncbi:unnamed protein product [Camellia sinensis]